MTGRGAAPSTDASPPDADTALVARGVRVEGDDGTFRIVDEIDLRLQRGRTLGIVGESGSGKTTVAMSLLGFARTGTRIAAGTVQLGETGNLLALSGTALRRRRGRDIAYVPQDPSTGLTPGMRIGRALREMLEAHAPGEADPAARVAAALREAQLPDDEVFQRRYPFELSGGQQQRVAIALALICRPAVIVMDEPTTGLDVTTQARLLVVIRSIVRDSDTALVYVSHDLGVIRSLVDEVAVMYGGRIVEQGPVDEVFTQPRHPYTRALLEAVPRVSLGAFKPRAIPGDAVEPWDWPSGCPFAPRCRHRTDACDEGMPPREVPGPERMVRCIHWAATAGEPPEAAVVREPGTLAALGAAGSVLEVEGLRASYGGTGGFLRRRHVAAAEAVKGISFTVAKGSCVAIVGESGSGKTTTLRCIAGLHEPAGGTIRFEDAQLAGRARQRAAQLRRQVQLVPQNPDSSLNPRRTVGEIIGRPLRQFFGSDGRERSTRVDELLDQVHLRSAMSRRYPRELSGGEKQRVAIARALAARPELLLCDEVVSALDVAVQAGILELLEELRTSLGTTLVFVTHDLAVVRSVASSVVVMQDGVVREIGETETIFQHPADAYTRELLAAVPHLLPTDYPGELAL